MSALYECLPKHRKKGLIALRFARRAVSYDTLVERVDQMAAYLKANGVKRGDTVTVSLPNIPAAVYVFYALDKLGARQNILHPLTSPENLLLSMREEESRTAILLATAYGGKEALFEESGYRFFFANPVADASLLKSRLFYLRYKKPRGKDLLLLEGYRRVLPDTAPPEEELADGILLHSGGTTGVPKVIALSARAFTALGDKVPAITEGDIRGRGMLAVLPAFHGFGLGMGIHAPLQNGATVVLMMKFNADEALSRIEKRQVSLLIGVPLLYRKLMAAKRFAGADLSSLTHAFVGGDNVPPSLLFAFDLEMERRGVDCRLLEGYGLTETVTVCAVNTKSESRPLSVGRPLPGITLLTVDESLSPLPEGEVGEVLIGGDTQMTAYRRDPEATEGTLVSVGGRTYVRSGDLGLLQDGFLYLKGRKKRQFKISGMNIYPAEIERLSTDNDSVADASLEFFEEPTPHTVLFLIRKKDAPEGEEAISARLTALFEERLLKYARPQAIVFLDEFPKTAIGKTLHGGFSHP